MGRIRGGGIEGGGRDIDGEVQSTEGRMVCVLLVTACLPAA